VHHSSDVRVNSASYRSTISRRSSPELSALGACGSLNTSAWKRVRSRMSMLFAVRWMSNGLSSDTASGKPSGAARAELGPPKSPRTVLGLPNAAAVCLSSVKHAIQSRRWFARSRASAASRGGRPASCRLRSVAMLARRRASEHTEGVGGKAR
jgi:hypothetical protein